MDVAAEGKAIAKVNDLVIFVPYVVPGDVVDLQIKRKKNNYRPIVQFLSASTMVFAAAVNGKCYPIRSRSDTSKSRWKTT